MTNGSHSGSNNAWAIIDQEKRRDRLLRRISIAAWSVTFLIVVIIATMIGIQVTEMWKAAREGMVPYSTVIAMSMPLVIVLGMLSVLIATLSTIGIFLRLRTASLTEIQLRLAALEDMLASRGDARP
jgi:predicted transporter